METTHFPEMIKNLPEADIPFSGVRAWISQGKDQQVAFMEIEPIGKVDPHAHGAQWGIVVEGEMELTIGGSTRTYRKGDSYFIPAEVVHSANFKQRTWVIDYFDDKNRYTLRDI
jgi:quercetin dioxygenase-like cupin family protein